MFRPGNVLRSAIGAQPGGALHSVSPFNTATVKPYLSPAAIKEVFGPNADLKQLAQAYTLPSKFTRNVPLLNTPVIGFSKAVDALDRNRVTHPLVYGTKAISNLLTKPITNPFLATKYPVLNKAINATYRTGMTVPIVATAYNFPKNLRNNSAEEFGYALERAGVAPHLSAEAKNRFRDNFWTGYFPNTMPEFLGGESSPLADAHRDYARKLMIRKIQDNMYRNATDSDNKWKNRFAQLSPGGYLWHQVSKNQTPISLDEYEQAMKETAVQHGPGVVYDLWYNKQPDNGLAKFYKDVIQRSPFGNSYSRHDDIQEFTMRNTGADIGYGSLYPKISPYADTSRVSGDVARMIAQAPTTLPVAVGNDAYNYVTNQSTPTTETSDYILGTPRDKSGPKQIGRMPLLIDSAKTDVNHYGKPVTDVTGARMTDEDAERLSRIFGAR